MTPKFAKDSGGCSVELPDPEDILNVVLKVPGPVRVSVVRLVGRTLWMCDFGANRGDPCSGHVVAGKRGREGCTGARAGDACAGKVRRARDGAVLPVPRAHLSR